MSKKIKTTTTLVIVESPAKCKKIEEYLGPGYKCIATYGHLRTILSIKHIDIEHQFNPTYTIIDEPLKKRQIELIRNAIKQSDTVLLGLDNDREGEKIAYCVAQLFGLDINTTKRITFNEITEPALQHAIRNPRTIDMNIVYAQQARQILDVLVGFKISPILWKCISQPKGKDHSLSAGRCQTPALKLVYENQQEINKATEKKIYNTIGYFTNSNLPFELNKQIEDEDDTIDFLDKSINFSHIYTCSSPTKIWKQPPEPFTTSRLQQMASNELHYSPKETMHICQRLYEAGYITYMRTDSNKYSVEFLSSASDYIKKSYDDTYFDSERLLNGVDNAKLRKKKKSDVTKQEAHEAIRPTNISLHMPEEIDIKEQKMYKLIWTNTMESCMKPASFYAITATITAPENAIYSYTTELIDFPGWKIVENKFSRENKEYYYLQTIKKNAPIQHKKICASVSIKGSKLHYTEARLVQLLEEKGIGRPSTFSSLIDKIQERGYVKKENILGKEIVCRNFELENGEICEIENKRVFGNEKNKLVIQPLGIIVMEFLNQHFQSLFEYEYTSLMEVALDKTSKGELSWVDICTSCNNEVDQLINAICDKTKCTFQIDDQHTFIIGKHGPVIKCIEEVDGKETISFKSVKTDINMSKLKNGELALNEIATDTNGDHILGQYEGEDVILRKGKFGLYITWGENTKTLKSFGNRAMDNITLEEVKPLIEKGSGIVRTITPYISIRNGPKGDYIFYKNAKMKKPSFYDIKQFSKDTTEDYKICEIDILQSWISKKYNI